MWPCGSRSTATCSAGVGAATTTTAPSWPSWRCRCVLYLLAVPAALLLKAALSRRREAMADESGVQLTREPGGLRSALEKLEADTSVVAHPSHAAAHLWIESPLRTTPDDGIRGWLSRAFDTHPPLADRIAQLRTYEGLDPNGRGPNDAVPAGF